LKIGSPPTQSKSFQFLQIFTPYFSGLLQLPWVCPLVALRAEPRNAPLPATSHTHTRRPRKTERPHSRRPGLFSPSFLLRRRRTLSFVTAIVPHPLRTRQLVTLGHGLWPAVTTRPRGNLHNMFLLLSFQISMSDHWRESSWRSCDATMAGGGKGAAGGWG
jgi:hypothetical protein